jgi:hypothetical protein
MQEEWPSSVLDDGHPYNDLSIGFNIDEDARLERELVFGRTEDGSLYAVMQSGGRKRSTRGYAKVSRPDERTVVAVFPRNLLRRGLDSYQWMVESRYHHPDDPDCGDTGGVAVSCYDRAPDKGTIAHRL